MKQKYQDYLYSRSNKDALIKMAKSDFTILTNGAQLLKIIIFNPNCDNEVLELLIGNKSTPFDKLEARILDGIARREIKTLRLLSLAIKRFMNDRQFKQFMLAIESNANYYGFTVKQNESIDNFNKIVAMHIQELETASTLAIIEDIKSKKALLEQQKTELIEQYPGIATQLSSISELDDAVVAATIRVTSAQSSSSSTPFTPMFNRYSTNSQRNNQESSAPSQSTRDPNIIDSEMIMNIFNSVPYI